MGEILNVDQALYQSYLSFRAFGNKKLTWSRVNLRAEI